jgi:hypothetical protein
MVVELTSGGAMSNDPMKNRISFFVSCGLIILADLLALTTLFLQTAEKLKKPIHLHALLTVCVLILAAALTIAIIKRCTAYLVAVFLMFNGLLILGVGIYSIFGKLELPYVKLSCAQYFWTALALSAGGYGLFMLYWDRRYSE